MRKKTAIAPKIRIHVPRRPQPGTAAGVGDRALLRIEKTDEGEGALYRGRVIKVIDHARTRVLGIFRSAARRRRTAGSGRQEAGRPRIEHRQAPTPAAPRTAISSASIWCARAAYGLASGKVKERLGSLATEKAVSLIAIHAHEIPQAFSPAALREAEEAKPATLEGREDWRDLPLVTIDPPDAKDHDDAVHAEPDPDPNNKGGYHRHMSRSPTSPSMCGRARRSIATR